MNVFKRIVFCTLLLAGSTICSGQEISIRGGYNMSRIIFKQESRTIEGVQSNPGFNLGTIIAFPLKGRLSLETGLLFTSKGFQQKGVDPSGTLYYSFKRDMYYLEVPVLMKGSFPVGKVELFGMIGPYVAYGLYGYDHTTGTGEYSSAVEKTSVKWGNDEYYKLDRLDYGPKFGAGININKFQLGVSYGLGLKNYSNISTLKQKNRVVEIYIACKIVSLKRTPKN